jgi:ankyrin repeat protein
LCRQLLDKGADVAGGGGSGWSPLDLAARLGGESVVALLLDRGAVPPGSNRGDSALAFAVYYGHPGIARLLVPHVSEDAKRRTYAFTPLHEAAFFGDEARVRQILGGGAVDVNAKGKAGMTALHLACWSGHVGIARLLLEAGADKEARYFAFTPLLEAARFGRLDVMRLLLEHGADAAVKGVADLTPLHNAAARLEAADSVAVASLLLERGAAAIDARDNIGRTALLVAIGHRNPSLASFLVERGADVNAADAEGRTPLSLARGKGLRDVARQLEERGARE